MRTLLNLLGLSACVVLLASLIKDVEAKPDRTILVELFTSQGCSSCPPADKVLRELAKNNADVLALSMHVDYWNYIGWTDPFSDEQYTMRQRSYQVNLDRGNAYTPQMIVDGVYDVVGSNEEKVRRAITRAASDDVEPVHVVVMENGEKLKVSIPKGLERTANVYLIGFDKHKESNVLRGENAGRISEHSNVVTSFIPIAEVKENQVDFSVEVNKPASENWAVIVQDSVTERVLGLEHNS